MHQRAYNSPTHAYIITLPMTQQQLHNPNEQSSVAGSSIEFSLHELLLRVQRALIYLLVISILWWNIPIGHSNR